MPSELQRVARGLVDCLDEVPQVVDRLHRTAARCRENAALAAQGGATTAAHQLDAAARSCEAAAHYLSLAPPKARTWADRLVTTGPATKNPATNSPDRNPLTTDHDLVVDRNPFEDFHKAHENDDDTPLPEDPLEPELVVLETAEWRPEEPTDEEREAEADRRDHLQSDHNLVVDPKPFEDFHKAHENDDDSPLPEGPLEPEFVLPETAEWRPEEPTDEEREEQEAREERLQSGYELTLDPDDRAQLLLAAMAGESEPLPPLAPEVLIEPLPQPDHFDPAPDLHPLTVDFAPIVVDPSGSFLPHERATADRLVQEGWRVDARVADHTRQGQKNPDVVVRKSTSERGVVVEFKTPTVRKISAVKRNMNTGSTQAGPDGEVVVDGRLIDLSEEDATRAYRRACGQAGSTVARMVHVILGDGRLVTYVKES